MDLETNGVVMVTFLDPKMVEMVDKFYYGIHRNGFLVPQQTIKSLTSPRIKVVFSSTKR